MTCQSCGAPLDPRDRFCSRCGAIAGPVAGPVAAVPARSGPSRGVLAAIGIVAATALVAGLAAWAVTSRGSVAGGTTGGNAGMPGTWLGGGATVRSTSPTSAASPGSSPADDATPGMTLPTESATPTDSPTETATPTPTAFALTPAIAIDTVGRFENYLKEDQPEKARELATTTFQKNAAGTDWFAPTGGAFLSFEVVRAERLRGGAYRVLVHEVWRAGKQDVWFTVVPFNGRAYVNAAVVV